MTRRHQPFPTSVVRVVWSAVCSSGKHASQNCTMITLHTIVNTRSAKYVCAILRPLDEFKVTFERLSLLSYQTQQQGVTLPIEGSMYIRVLTGFSLISQHGGTFISLNGWDIFDR